MSDSLSRPVQRFDGAAQPSLEPEVKQAMLAALALRERARASAGAGPQPGRAR